MHSLYTRGVVSLVFGALLLLGAAQAQAHALYAAHTWQGAVALVQFAYAGGSVPTYAKVEVYSPADAKVEFQNGRTDAQGRFAFMPDTPGQWRIIMADNMGHRVEHAVDVSPSHGSAQIAAQTSGPNTDKPAANGATPGVGEFSVPLRVLLGLSLLANMALGAAVLRRRKNQG
jgi:nickel transport protein